jgi:importin-9
MVASSRIYILSSDRDLSFSFLSLFLVIFFFLLSIATGYMQMSADQIERWVDDPGRFLGEEEQEFWSARASGEMLLDEAAESLGDEALAALASAAQRRTQEAVAARDAGSPDWWRAREAALLGVGAIAERLEESGRGGRRLPLDPSKVVRNVLDEDLRGDASPFLLVRGLWLLGRLAPTISPELIPDALAAAAAALSPTAPPLVQVGGCQALSALCENADPKQVAPISQQAFAGLCSLLTRPGEDLAHLAMEALARLVRADPTGAAAWEPHITGPAMQAWVSNVADPLLGEDAQELLQALAASPACLPNVQARALPTLMSVIGTAEDHPSLLVDGCLEFLVSLLAPSTREVAARISEAATQAVTRLMVSADADEEVRATATAYVRTLLQVGKADALGWMGSADPGAAIAALMGAAEGLLVPAAGDRAACNVGGLVMEVIRLAGPAVVSAEASYLKHI